MPDLVCFLEFQIGPSIGLCVPGLVFMFVISQFSYALRLFLLGEKRHQRNHS